jgi:hypothetical protein
MSLRPSPPAADFNRSKHYMSNEPRNSLVALTTRFAFAGLAAALLAASACGGEAPADEQTADVRATTTTNFVLTGVDSQPLPVDITCSDGSIYNVNGGTLAIVGNATYSATLQGTEAGQALSVSDKGKVSVSGDTYTLTSPRNGTLVGTLSGSVLTVTGSYCGGNHSLVYQQQ